MKSLLDVSTLVAVLIEGHEFHEVTVKWLDGRKVALCPISELGFLRVAGLAYGVPLPEAREVLQQFKAAHKAEFLPCDVSALEGRAASAAGKTTDFYLANLAEKHGMKWATLDSCVKHPAVVVVQGARKAG